MNSFVSLSALRGAAANRHAVAIGNSYSTCGNFMGRCVNNWKCVQRQGVLKHTCPADLRDQRRG